MTSTNTDDTENFRLNTRLPRFAASENLNIIIRVEESTTRQRIEVNESRTKTQEHDKI